MKNAKLKILFAIFTSVVLISLASCAHEHSTTVDDWVVDKEATCTEPGLKRLVCSCGQTLETKEIPALGHDFNEGVCQVCDGNASIGLRYTLNEDNETYSVSGLGTCTDTDIVIPQTYYGKLVTRIGNEAFGSENITSIRIPKGVKSIGDHSLMLRNNSTSITVDPENEVYRSAGNCLIEISTKTLVAGFPNSIIPDDGSVTRIGDSSFYMCYGLTSIEIPDEVTSIGKRAFERCFDLTSVKIGKGVTRIDENAFYCCTSLASVKLGDSVTSIGENAFYKCRGLTGIEIPDSVMNIGNSAFYACESLANVKLGDGVKSIGKSAFEGCNGLTSIEIPNGVEKISSMAFRYCGLTSVSIGDGVTNISERMFDSCARLTNIVIPDSVTKIGMYAFVGCNSLESINFTGTKAQWYAIEKEYSCTDLYTVNCTDGTIPKENS